MIFKAEYSLEQDVQNHLNSEWKFNYPLYGRENVLERNLSAYPKDYVDKLSGAKTEEKAGEIVTEYLKSLTNNFLPVTEIIAFGVGALLNEKKEEIVGELEKVYGERFPFNEIQVYLTTARMCPYDYEGRWFMSGRNSSAERHINTAKHELNHFMFYHYFSFLKNELEKEKFEILKEALAVYTNPEGNDKPDVKALEDYFQKNLDKSIPEVIKEGMWRLV